MKGRSSGSDDGVVSLLPVGLTPGRLSSYNIFGRRFASKKRKDNSAILMRHAPVRVGFDDTRSSYRSLHPSRLPFPYHGWREYHQDNNNVNLWDNDFSVILYQFCKQRQAEQMTRRP